jgi:hypothetical protein
MGPLWLFDSPLSDRALSLCRLTGIRCKVFEELRSTGQYVELLLSRRISRDTATFSNADRLATKVLELACDDQRLFLA